MELGLIEYLENKNFDVDSIRKLEERFLNSDSEKIIKKFESIYKIFGYANLDGITINSLIVNNPGLLTKTDSEIINIAYSWLDTNLLSDAAERKRGILHERYDRTYLRNLYLNSDIKYYGQQMSFNVLTSSDDDFGITYRGQINNVEFYPTYKNLIYIYGKGNNLEEKQKYIKSVISNLALKWFCDCLKKDKEKQNENKPLY